jgi:hypothetical protein
MFKICGIKKFSPSEYETLFPSMLSVHAPLRDVVLLAYAYSARIGPGLPHCSKHLFIDIVQSKDEGTLAGVDSAPVRNLVIFNDNLTTTKQVQTAAGRNTSETASAVTMLAMPALALLRAK